MQETIFYQQMYYAIKNKEVNSVLALLDLMEETHFYLLTALSHRKTSMIHLMAIQGLVEGVEKINQKFGKTHPKIWHTLDDDGHTPFTIAIMNCQRTMIQYFIANKLDNFATPVHCAAFTPGILSHDMNEADFNTPDVAGNLPIVYAAVAGDVMMFELALLKTSLDKIDKRFLVKCMLEHHHENLLALFLSKYSGEEHQKLFAIVGQERQRKLIRDFQENVINLEDEQFNAIKKVESLLINFITVFHLGMNINHRIAEIYEIIKISPRSLFDQWNSAMKDKGKLKLLSGFLAKIILSHDGNEGLIFRPLITLNAINVFCVWLNYIEKEIVSLNDVELSKSYYRIQIQVLKHLNNAMYVCHEFCDYFIWPLKADVFELPLNNSEKKFNLLIDADLSVDILPVQKCKKTQNKNKNNQYHKSQRQLVQQNDRKNTASPSEKKHKNIEKLKQPAQEKTVSLEKKPEKSKKQENHKAVQPNRQLIQKKVTSTCDEKEITLPYSQKNQLLFSIESPYEISAPKRKKQEGNKVVEQSKKSHQEKMISHENKLRECLNQLISMLPETSNINVYKPEVIISIYGNKLFKFPRGVIEFMKLFQEKTQKGKIYLVGGAIRDKLLGKKNHDYDFVVVGLNLEELKQLFPQGEYKGQGNFRSFSLSFDEKLGAFDIVLCSIEQNNHYIECLRLHCGARDLTINAMLYHLEEGLIDFYNGLQDLHEKKINPVLVRTLKEDFISIMRAIRFSGKLDFSIDTKMQRDLIFSIKNILQVNGFQVNDQRVLQEYTSFLRDMDFDKAHELLRHYRLYSFLVHRKIIHPVLSVSIFKKLDDRNQRSIGCISKGYYSFFKIYRTKDNNFINPPANSVVTSTVSRAQRKT